MGILYFQEGKVPSAKTILPVSYVRQETSRNEVSEGWHMVATRALEAIDK